MKERYRVKAFVRLGNQTAEVNLIVDDKNEAMKLAEGIYVNIFIEGETSGKVFYDDRMVNGE